MQCKTINPCKLFGYDVAEGMKVFCIMELFLGLFNFIVALSFLNPWVKNIFVVDYSEDEDWGLLVSNLFVLIFMITLIIQTILAFLLYFLGWIKKNKIICIIWIVFASINFVMPWILLILTECNCGTPWSVYLLYLLYPIIGVWIVYNFIKTTF